jgi:nitroimidazol reductase NimA-like FMN-containing flavoprotein (pyridoxamine 5'-phosphate oxidase superfamily)
VEYKKKHEQLKVKFMDGTQKTMLVDTSMPVSDVIDHIGKRIALKDPAEFGIQYESNPGYSSLTTPLLINLCSTLLA